MIPWQSFWKNAKNIERRFSVMSQRKQYLQFVGLILSPRVFSPSTIFSDLSKRFCIYLNHLNFYRQGTISLFSTPNCQADPEWNPKIKVETQDLLAVTLHQI